MSEARPVSELTTESQTDMNTDTHRTHTADTAEGGADGGALAGPMSADPASTTLYVGPDIYARIIGFLVRWRSRLPGWRVATMGVLTTSEREGVILLEAAVSTLR